MSLHTALGCVAVLLALGPAAIAFSRSHYANSVVYGASLAISTAIAATALLALLTLGDVKRRRFFRSDCRGLVRTSGWTTSLPFFCW